MIRLAGAAALGLVFLLFPAPASAARGIAVELVSSPGAPSALPPSLATELEQLGFLSGKTLERRLRRLHSWPATEIDAEARSTAGRLVERGYQSYIRGEFDQAVADCERGLERLLRHPGSVARDQDLREHVYLAYVVLGMAENRRQNPERVSRAMRALIRSFPRRAPSLRRFGPEGKNLHRAAARALEREGSGRLEINADRDVLVYVNERFAGAGEVSEDLPPGPYRIYIERSGKPGRVHEVFLRPGERLELDLSFRLDRALSTGDGRVRLAAEGPASPGALELAVAFGESLALSRLVLVAASRDAGRPSLVGAYIDVQEGEVLRRARVPLDRSGGERTLAPEAARLFAEYLVRGRRGPGIHLLGGRADPVPSDRPRSERWAVPLLSGGLAALAAGGILLGVGLSRDCGGERRDARCSRTVGATEIGAASLGVGAAAVGVGTYLWMGTSREEGRGPAGADQRLVAGIGWEF